MLWKNLYGKVYDFLLFSSSTLLYLDILSNRFKKKNVMMHQWYQFIAILRSFNPVRWVDEPPSWLTKLSEFISDRTGWFSISHFNKFREIEKMPKIIQKILIQKGVSVWWLEPTALHWIASVYWGRKNIIVLL